jgi:uncharacterized protein YceK
MKKIVIKMLCMVLVLSTIILSGCGTIRFTVNNSLGSNTKLTGEEFSFPKAYKKYCVSK